MLEQPSLLRSLLAFMLFLLLASTNLVSANYVCKCGNGDVDTPSKKVVDYNVGISESGEQYNETIEVDTEKQTELFKVPAHRDVDQSNILHDFKMNMSLLLLPEKKICYLLPLDKDLPTPRKLLSDLDIAEKSVKKISETRIIEHKWTLGSQVTDRSVLGDELATFCPTEYPIYHVKRMEDTLTPNRIQTGGRRNRNRRQATVSATLVDLSEYVCPGGKSNVSVPEIAQCIANGKRWKVKCKITTTTCYYIRTCISFDICYRDHLRNQTFCCEYLCE